MPKLLLGDVNAREFRLNLMQVFTQVFDGIPKLPPKPAKTSKDYSYSQVYEGLGVHRFMPLSPPAPELR